MHVPYVIFIQNIYGMLFCSFAVKETKTAKDVTVVSYFFLEITFSLKVWFMLYRLLSHSSLFFFSPKTSGWRGKSRITMEEQCPEIRWIKEWSLSSLSIEFRHKIHSKHQINFSCLNVFIDYGLLLI